MNGLKEFKKRKDALIVMTAPLNKFSTYKPEGGNILTHFGKVLVLINDAERFTEYALIEHPFMAENKIKIRKAVRPKRGLRKPVRNSSIQEWC